MSGNSPASFYSSAFSIIVPRPHSSLVLWKREDRYPMPILEKGVLKMWVLGPSHTPQKSWDLSSSSDFLTLSLLFSTAVCYRDLFAIIIVGDFMWLLMIVWALLIIPIITVANYYRISITNTTLVLLLGKSHGRRSLLGCNPWGR